MKTILHITEVSSGGVLPVIYALCNGAADDYKVIFAYGIRPDTPKNIEHYFDSRVILIPIPEFSRELNLKKDIKVIRILKRIVKEYCPDIVHMHSSKAGYCGRLALINSKSKKLYSPHGYSFLKPDNSMTKKIIYLTAEKVLTLLGGITLACSDSELRVAKRLDRKALCLKNCLDTSFVDAAIVKRRSDTLKAYAVGRISPQKNPKAFDLFARRFPNIDFMWIGGGEDKNLLTSPNIEVTGVVSREDVIKLACECDFYLSFSPSEGLPIALQEAMYMKKICLVSNVSGNNDLISNSTGYLFDSIEECEKCFNEILNDVEGARQKAEMAYQRIISEFTIEKMCMNYDGIIGNLLWN